MDENNGKSGILRDAMCSACEMAVVWMQNQLTQNQTQERILDYANEVRTCIILTIVIFKGIDSVADPTFCFTISAL